MPRCHSQEIMHSAMTGFFPVPSTRGHASDNGEIEYCRRCLTCLSSTEAFAGVFGHGLLAQASLVLIEPVDM